jgi:hypothetical protein
VRCGAFDAVEDGSPKAFCNLAKANKLLRFKPGALLARDFDGLSCRGGKACVGDCFCSLGQQGPDGGTSMSKDVVQVEKNGPSKPRLQLGAAQVLAHCKDVVEAFGRPLGFIIIMTALMPGMAVSVGTVVAVSKAIGRYLG